MFGIVPELLGRILVWTIIVVCSSVICADRFEILVNFTTTMAIDSEWIEH